MKIYLASPHTILRFRGGGVIADAIFRRGITNDNLHGGGGIRESETRMETDEGEYP